MSTELGRKCSLISVIPSVCTKTKIETAAEFLSAGISCAYLLYYALFPIRKGSKVTNAIREYNRVSKQSECYSFVSGVRLKAQDSNGSRIYKSMRTFKGKRDKERSSNLLSNSRRVIFKRVPMIVEILLCMHTITKRYCL